MKSKKSAALELVTLCCRALDEKKAGNLTVLDVAAASSITDFLVLATATSEPHLRALRIELEKALDAAKVRIVGMDTGQASGWFVIDAFDVMVHLFLPATREHYGLERLWRDATEVSVSKLLKPTAPKKVKTTPALKSVKKKKPAPRKRGS